MSEILRYIRDDMDIYVLPTESGAYAEGYTDSHYKQGIADTDKKIRARFPVDNSSDLVIRDATDEEEKIIDELKWDKLLPLQYA